MKDILTDIVAHTHSLSILPLVKITGTETETAIEAMADMLAGKYIKIYGEKNRHIFQ